MQHAIRRKDRIMETVAAHKLLEAGEYGVLATTGPDGWPYAVPLSYIKADNALYFHCALTGHKIEHITANPKVCFTVVGKTQPVYDKNFTTYYESVVVFGQIFEVRAVARKTALLMQLAQKYLPGDMDKAPADIAKSLARTAVYGIKIEQLTGKAKKPR